MRTRKGMGRTTFIVYGLLLVLAAGLAVYALRPEMLRNIPFLSDVLPQEDLIVTLRRSDSGKIIIIQGTSTFNYTEVKNMPISIVMTPTAGNPFGVYKSTTYKIYWREIGREYDPVNRIVISKGSYSFEATILVFATEDFEIQVNVGGYSKEFISKSPVI